jgi:hypothetical protein
MLGPQRLHETAFMSNDDLAAGLINTMDLVSTQTIAQ